MAVNFGCGGENGARKQSKGGAEGCGGGEKKIILKQQLWSISWLSIPGVPGLLGFIRLASLCMRMLCQYISMLPLQSFFNKSEREQQTECVSGRVGGRPAEWDDSVSAECVCVCLSSACAFARSALSMCRPEG